MSTKDKLVLGYAKLGRSMGFDPKHWGMQADAEAPNLLVRLAKRNPDVTFALVGKHTPITIELPPNVYDPWPSWSVSLEDVESVIGYAQRELNGMIMHVGQHGTSQVPIPLLATHWVDDDWTNPLCSAQIYGGYLIRILNYLGDKTNGKFPVSWIVPDPRNYVKARDLKWPMGLDHVLSQTITTQCHRHDRWLDPRSPEELGYEDVEIEREGEIWRVHHHYRHSGAELMILDDDWEETWGLRPFEERTLLGVASTAFWNPNAEWRRSRVIREWVLDWLPAAEIFGYWDPKCVKADGTPALMVQTNEAAKFGDVLGRWLCSLALPPAPMNVEDLKWATAKQWQIMAANTVCFMQGPLDQHGWVIPSIHPTEHTHELGEGLYSVRQEDDWTRDELFLARWLRVDTPAEFQQRVNLIGQSEKIWEWATRTQRGLLKRRWDRHQLEEEIECQQRIGAWAPAPSCATDTST